MEKDSPDHSDPVEIFAWLMTTPDSPMWELPENKDGSQEKGETIVWIALQWIYTPASGNG